MSQNTCDKCKFWRDPDPTLVGLEFDGDCESDKFMLEECVEDGLSFERSRVTVGPKFGCVHWSRK